MDHAGLKKLIHSVITDIVEEQTKNISSYNTKQNNIYDPRMDSAKVPIEISARHVHLSEEDVSALFGTPLTYARELSQPGQYLCEQRVRLVGPKGVLDNVAILGPARKSSQVEISKTDARILGINAPVRQSGDVKNSPGIILTAQNNLVALEEGVIVAARHIHMSPEDAKLFNLKDNDFVTVRLETERPLILEDVLVRVDNSFKLAMHIDSDEGNSASWVKGLTGCIVGKKERPLT